MSLMNQLNKNASKPPQLLDFVQDPVVPQGRLELVSLS